jgi:signal transduction histidine kinase
MKRFTQVALGFAVILCLAGFAMAAESGTKDECVAKTKEAGKMVTDKGVEATIAEVNKKDGKFVWKDTYVFLMDLDGKMIAHPMNAALIGKNVLDMKDKGDPGKLLFVEMVKVGKDKGEGWVDYMWTNPGDPKPRKKVTYIYRVPGKNVLAGAGVYE